MKSIPLKLRIELKERLLSEDLKSDPLASEFIATYFRAIKSIPSFSTLLELEKKYECELIIPVLKTLSIQNSRQLSEFEFRSGFSYPHRPLLWFYDLEGKVISVSKKANKLTKMKNAAAVGAERYVRKRANEFVKMGLSVGRGSRQHIYFDQQRLRQMALKLEDIIGVEAIRQIHRDEQSLNRNHQGFKNIYPKFATVRARDQVYADMLNWRISLDAPDNFKNLRKIFFKSTDIHKWIYSAKAK